jgi:hypothetical protein
MRARTTISAGTFAALAAAPVLLVATPAGAAPALAERELLVDSSAWSWRQSVPQGQPVSEPSNVPAGDLAVAFDGRQDPPAKATYLRLALGDLPAGSTVTALRLVLALDPAVDQDPSRAPLVACSLKGVFIAGSGVDPAKQPAESCTGAPKGVYDATTQTVSFALTAVARSWYAGQPNYGVVVRPDPAATAPSVLPFQLAFRGAPSIAGQLKVALPVQDQAPVETPVAPAPPVASGPAPIALAPFAPAPLPTEPPAAVVPLPTTAAQPEVARITRTALEIPNVRAAGRASTAGFATAAALGLLLVVLIGSSLGAQADPMVRAREERRRLDRLRLLPLGQPVQIRQGRKPESSATSTLT